MTESSGDVCALVELIAKSLVELHGGAIRIRSIQGVGTIVLVRLPIAGVTSGGEAASTLAVTFEAAS